MGCCWSWSSAEFDAGWIRGGEEDFRRYLGRIWSAWIRLLKKSLLILKVIPSEEIRISMVGFVVSKRKSIVVSLKSNTK